MLLDTPDQDWHPDSILDMEFTYVPVDEDSHIFYFRIGSVLRFSIPINFNPLSDRIVVFCIHFCKKNADLTD